MSRQKRPLDGIDARIIEMRKEQCTLARIAEVTGVKFESIKYRAAKLSKLKLIERFDLSDRAKKYWNSPDGVQRVRGAFAAANLAKAHSKVERPPKALMSDAEIDAIYDRVGNYGPNRAPWPERAQDEQD